MPSLYAINDKSKGDSGGRSEAILWKEDGSFDKVVGSRPVVGCSMLVGSSYPRTTQWQDHWITTPVLEILEERDDYVKFRTKNTVYEWKMN